MNTIELAGRSFEVEVIDGERWDLGRCAYRLTGVRGANYKTFRNKPNPDIMFLCAFRTGRHPGFTVDPLGPLWLTDKDGPLREHRR